LGILNKLFGFRWSIYIVRNGNELVYAMHENSAMRMLGYIMGYYKNGNTPVKPWSLHLNFNKKHEAIKLESEHFTPDGEVTSALIQQVSAIDPGWKVKGNEPVFEEASTKKKIKIRAHGAATIDLQAMIDNAGKPKEVTFYTVMDQVFGK
jgi:hypothetical protein|tara:strand:- start:1638 stop:2087 length:450 start_codon:yes stop_codon:yes gene_type:complete